LVLEDRGQKVLELLDSAGQRLHRLLTRLSGSEQATSDLFQELFVRLCNSRGLETAKDPMAYAWRSAVNLAFEWRRNRKKAFIPLEEEYMPAENQPVALEHMVRAEEMEQVLEAMAKLPPVAREVLVRRYLEQEPYEEMAARLGKKPQHLRAICSKALARLRVLTASDVKVSP